VPSGIIIFDKNGKSGILKKLENPDFPFL